jgi:hypothetical protein
MASLNGYSEDEPIDETGAPSNDLTYFAIVTTVNYDFGEYILPNTEWLDFYARAGPSYFYLENGNIFADFGKRFKLCFTRNKSVGINGALIRKLALNHSDKGDNYANNHFQYILQMVLRR